MSREIKFRAWDTTKSQWTDLGGLAMELETGQLCCSWVDSLYVGESGESRKPEEFILEQFTGLVDKNGVEIYEGDVIKYENSIESGIGEIKPFFSGTNLHCVWITQHTTSPSLYTSIDYLGCSAEIEILGNIYENPEFVEAMA